MKTLASKYLLVVSIVLTFIVSGPNRLIAEDAPTYRGKVVLVVDRTIASDPDVSWRIERLINDLTGDGWRVLRHDVDRGPVHPYDGLNISGYNLWAAQNAPRVREVRALIKADYDAAPADVKQVLLLGHIPVPYSGVYTNGSLVVGNHSNWGGAYPADFFYGEMTAQYWSGGWSDFNVGTDVPVLPGPPLDRSYWEFTNSPEDGKFDQEQLPAAPKLAVGRVDLNNMFFFGVNESTLVARYLDKDHDFRCGNFSVQRKAFNGTDANSGDFGPVVGFERFVGSGNVLSIRTSGSSWFPYVSGSTSYLLGFGAGFGSPFGSVETVGSSIDFAQTDSHVAFVNLYGSFFGLWDEPDDIMRAVLANPYDPANGRLGYGLTAAFDGFGIGDEFGDLDVVLTNRTLGATIGEAMLNQTSYTTAVGWALMGDPTLRLHSIQEPSNITLAKTQSQVVLNWSSSSDTAVTGYNIYRAPTRRGPYVLVNSDAQVTGNSYTVTRPGSGDAPDNFYMIRAVKTETTPVGNYTNMSDGLIFSLPGMLTPYLVILNQPASQKLAPTPSVGVANSVVFTVDAVGADAAGNSQVTYQWYKDGNPLWDDGHFKGATTSSLLVAGLQKTDAGNYYVVVSNSKLYDGQSELSSINSITSSGASLTVVDPPTANPDSYEIQRNTPSDFEVIANDTDPDTANSDLILVSISALSDPTAGTLSINPDQRTIHFVPSRAWLGPVTFTYIITDGTTPSQATVTINVIPKNGNQPPDVSSIADQQMNEDAIIDVPFTVSDDFTTPDYLRCVITCSVPALIPNANFSTTGSGGNRILHIKAGTHQIGSGTVTMVVTDEDNASTTVPDFQVAISSLNIPTLLSVGMQSDGFHFTINGPANSSVEIKESDDLGTWASLGNVTLSGGLYSFVDAAAGFASHRFYTAANQNGCSANTIGFMTVTVPAKDINGVSQYIALANQLNNPAGNTVDILFPDFQKQSQVQTWDPILAWITAQKSGTPAVWSSTPAINPGVPGMVHAGGTTPLVETLIGDVPEGQQVQTFDTVAGNSYFLGSIIPRAGTLDQLGFPAMEGDQLQQFINYQWTTTAAYSSGAWSSSPTIQIGEPFFIISGATGNRVWTETFSPCP
jgi:hypothetical protein